MLHIVHHAQQVAPVRLAEGEAADGPVVEILGAEDVQRLQRHRVPDPAKIFGSNVKKYL